MPDARRLFTAIVEIRLDFGPSPPQRLSDGTPWAARHHGASLVACDHKLPGKPSSHLKGGETIAPGRIPLRRPHIDPSSDLWPVGWAVHPYQVNACGRAPGDNWCGQSRSRLLLSAALKNALDAGGYASLTQHHQIDPRQELALRWRACAEDVTASACWAIPWNGARAKMQARIAMDAVPRAERKNWHKRTHGRLRRMAGYGAQVALADSLSAIDKGF